MIENEEVIRQEAISFFSNILFDDFVLSMADQDQLLEVIPSLVTEDLNCMLCCIPSTEEVRSVVFSFVCNKAPGPDNFPMFFFQKIWSIISKDVVNVTIFFGFQNLLKELNGTFLVLILKIPGTSTFNEFRPINLCNLIYKIFSKVLSMRLQRFFLRLSLPIRVALLLEEKSLTPSLLSMRTLIL